MARNKIAANTAIFNHLDDYAARAALPVPNAGQARWIATTPPEQKTLVDFALTDKFRISPTRLIGRFDHGTETLFVYFGFSEGFECDPFPSIDVDAGLLTAALAELLPQPTASALEISNIVGANDRRTQGYAGHDSTAIGSLFPRCGAVAGEDLARTQSPRVFFKLCLDEALMSGSWIGDQLGRDLDLLFSLDLLEIPYSILSRSLFDVDPASLFLALYRSIEFLYVYTSAQKLKSTLGLKQDWSAIGAALEDDLGWFPREATSLQSLLEFADIDDLSNIIVAISGSCEHDESRIPVIAGRLIYNLRNSIVHFRPAHRQLDRDSINWQKLCSATVQVVLYIYSEIFQSI